MLKCLEVTHNTSKYLTVQQSTPQYPKYLKVPHSISKYHTLLQCTSQYLRVPDSRSKYLTVPRSTSKYPQLYRHPNLFRPIVGCPSWFRFALFCMVLYPYTAERRDVLGCTSPTTKKFPWFALRTSQGLREILRSEGMYIVQIHPDSRQCSAIISSLLIHSIPP